MSQFFPQLRRRDSYTGTHGISGYRRYRLEIAEDCLRRCVYCDSKDSEIGGDPMMELDHFRPISLFDHLKDNPRNLVYACRSCNGKKKHDWPAGNDVSTHLNGEGYLDPFLEDRRTYFSVTAEGEFLEVRSPASYLIRRLALNRPLLRCLRKRSNLLLRLKDRINNMVPKLEAEIQRASPEIAPLLKELLAILELQQTINGLI